MAGKADGIRARGMREETRELECGAEGVSRMCTGMAQVLSSETGIQAKKH